MSRTKSIIYDKGTFHIKTVRTSYIFRVTSYGHLEHVHYGVPVRMKDAEPLSLKRTAQYGSSVMYAKGDETYCLDALPQEWSGAGRGDYRTPPIEAKMPDGGYTTDFRYVGHEIVEGVVPMACGLPSALGGAQTLAVLLRDGPTGAELTLYYTVYPDEDVITRRAVIKNNSATPLAIHKLMSLCVDLSERSLVMAAFGGGWIKEFQRTDREVLPGRIVNESCTGASSNRANPGFILYRKGAGEERGDAWGFNLVYSGNHQSSVEADSRGVVRVMCGINPDRFDWILGMEERFETPEAVMSFSSAGLGGLSRNMHDFVNRRIVRGYWAGRERPVLINSWEAFMFSFSRESLLDLARRGKRLGAELFVLDDGWFGERNDDKAGLGDYYVNKKKLPDGMEGLARRITKGGLKFGLWFEPEAVNEDSDLFRTHPDWAVSDSGRDRIYGRNELLLDFTRPEVREYIVASVGGVLDSAEISYVKWDMNRHMAGMDGAFAHRYILGLYEVLGRIFGPRPEILLESCSSGGNRFDLGMLCFSPQIWLSDNTDPIERLDIQKGASYLYPLSAMGAHVSASPHAQTLRATTLATRFNVSCFGCLGYELDLKELHPVEENEIKQQIKFYKRHRRTFQFGTFSRGEVLPDWQEVFSCVSEDGCEAVAGQFRRLVHSAPGFDVLSVPGLDSGAVYKVATKPQVLRFHTFGRLIKHALPVKLDTEGAVMRGADRLAGLKDCVEEYESSGAALKAGIGLSNLFNGTGYNTHIRLPGDFGSNLYLMTRTEKA
ncbi:MAG: alpha-galactosidase [Clostridia bacterium]|nr:alpha-galactosidase [Clostridia bacterium]